MQTELACIDECALKFLCIPGSSVESERIFSSTGQLLSEKRSRLKAKNVNMISFLHKNLNNL